MSDVSGTDQATLSVRVAEEIRGWMGKRRVTGAELARRLGVSQMWVSYRLSGKQPIDLNDLEMISKALSVPVRQLLPNDPAERVLTIPGSAEIPVIRTPDRSHVATITSPRGSDATAIHRPRRRPGQRDGSPVLVAAGMVAR